MNEGTSMFTLMFIVFLVLKLTGAISWSWWFITMPLWLPFSVVVCFMLFYFILILIKG